jgi:putative component of toxin-antitoxin plasmid stabilization module
VYTIVYTRAVIEVLKTRAFSNWFAALRDREAQRKIQARIDYLAVGG